MSHDAVPIAAPAVTGLFGRSSPMRALVSQIERVAPTDLPVLIIGESGTGKEAVAQAVHALSPRRDQPFIPVNCGAIAPALIEAELFGDERASFTGANRTALGCLERADGGTVLLDEITEMPPAAQVKLLRLLENRSFARAGGSEPVMVDVRVIAATSADIDITVREGRFRDDLRYRLAVFPLYVPPLRARGDDIELLAQHFLDELNRQERAAKSFSRNCLQQFMAHPWPGNVRELKDAVRRAFLMADGVIEAPFAEVSRRHRRPRRCDGRIEVEVGTALADAQRELIEATLEHFGGDKRRAAQALGVSLKTLYNRLEVYRNGSGMPIPESRPSRSIEQ